MIHDRNLERSQVDQFIISFSNNYRSNQNIRNDNQIKTKQINLHDKLFNKKENIVNINKFLNQRSYGQRTSNLSNEYGLKTLISNNLLKENLINIGEIDKVYSSCWLRDDFVMIGTKCNKLILINLNNGKCFPIPVVETECKNENKCGGNYGISVNPSRSLLATNTKGGNDIAIYSLPSLDILYVCENAHDDLIFDIVWLSDNYLASGSRDSNIALFKIDDNDNNEIDEHTNLYKIKSLNSFNKLNYKDCDKIRCLNFNKKRNEMVALSLNGQLHSIDIENFKINSYKFQYYHDIVCLAKNEDLNLYAVGSKSYIQLFDSRSLSCIATINAKTPESGTRSISFNSDILTVGTGNGNILFYDIRNSKYFNNNFNQELIVLKTSKGYIKNSVQENYGQFSQPEMPAIYTHLYDQTKTRLFAAGGPLVSNSIGNYCAIWS